LKRNKEYSLSKMPKEGVIYKRESQNTPEKDKDEDVTNM
jgi:hypothetical protein